ncbi:RNA-binding 42-like [Olea europaea subsp. europaea]|uniref:RNA-binding 42-like n=1 Tax=Olea europaea subsp. europaea TaxID=158383 RepID=A0A8S0V189_OLEEU|nr:RNA-binding 42-like [Olea europaea subsp. europaea]
MSMVPSTAAVSASSSSQYTYAAPTSSASYFPTPFHLQQTPAPVPYIGAAPPPPVPSVALPVYPAPPTVYSLPQYQQAQLLFQRDAQTITPEAIESDNLGRILLLLAEWPENDYRLFCGDLGNEVNDDVLSKAFARFPSFNMARVVRDKWTGKTKGYGFVSFSNPADLAAALKEMNGNYVGNRPIKLRKSTWRERTDVEAFERQKNQSQKKMKLPKKSVLHK